MTTKQPRVSTSSAGPFIAARKPFQNHSGSLQGTDAVWNANADRLSSLETAAFYNDRPYITYAVFSYFTPIAWYVSKPKVCGCCQDERWHIVNQKFSVTTSKHQSQLWHIRKETTDGPA